MKISYLNYMADLYGYSIGSTIKALKLLQNLESFGHSVYFHWLEDDRTNGPVSAQKTVASSLIRDFLYTPKQLLRNIFQFFKEQKIIRQDRPDLLIVRLDAFRLSALWLARLYRLPLIVEADGACSYEWLTFNNGRHLWEKVLLWCEKAVLNGADGVFTQSQAAKDYYVRVHGLDSSRISVITNGADLHQIGFPKIAALKTELGIPAHAHVIGFIGSMQQWHGLSDMRDLVRDILETYADSLFLFVGSGGALERDFKENFKDVGSRVIFTGTVPNERVPEYIRLFTIAVAPYPPMRLFYFSPMKIFEYMAAAVPIVASKSGQISDILQNERSALLYEPGNSAQLKAALVRLYNDAELCERLADHAFQLFLKDYTWKQKATELNQLLRVRAEKE